MPIKFWLVFVLSVRRLTLFILLLTLSACNSNPLIVEISDCPAVGLVRYANSLTAFAPGVTPVAGEVSHKAVFSSLEVDCQDKGEGVRTFVDFTISAKAGPKLIAEQIDILYFVVVARDGDDLQSKRIYTTSVSLDSVDGRGEVRERLEFNIPTNRQADRYLYEVLIGFELSDAEARYNLES
ncbi:MAG: hypothetical protein AAF607_01650 [Pseudomonadota bacterium]